MRKIILLLIVSGTLVVSGCGSEPAADKQKKADTSKVLSKKEQLHNKAKITEAASLVGYDGKKIHKDLDKFIDESAKREKMLNDIDDL